MAKTEHCSGPKGKLIKEVTDVMNSDGFYDSIQFLFVKDNEDGDGRIECFANDRTPTGEEVNQFTECLGRILSLKFGVPEVLKLSKSPKAKNHPLPDDFYELSGNAFVQVARNILLNMVDNSEICEEDSKELKEAAFQKLKKILAKCETASDFFATVEDRPTETHKSKESKKDVPTTSYPMMPSDEYTEMWERLLDYGEDE